MPAVASVFQPTLPARGATHIAEGVVGLFGLISTHAPRTGSDEARKELFEQHMMISTHAPRTGSDKSATTLLRAG